MTEQANFTGQVVLVTGAGRGTGKYIARAFAAQGAFVAVNDINPDSATHTVEQINAEGGKAGIFLADVSKKMPVQVMVNDIEDQLGRIDVLVNCAAVLLRKPLIEIDEWDWHRTIDVNLTAAFLTTQVVARLMRASQRGGSIVNINSSWDYGISQGGSAAFLAGQAAIPALTKSAANELAPYNIRVNAVTLGNMPGWDEPLTPIAPSKQALFDPAPDIAAAARIVLSLCIPAVQVTGEVFPAGQV